jgi:hypothetical protein
MPQAHRAVAFAAVHAEGPQAQQIERSAAWTGDVGRGVH